MASNRINILHTIVSAGRHSFGLGQVALNLVREQERHGHNSKIWSMDGEDDRDWAVEAFELENERIELYPRSWPSVLGHSREMKKAAQLLHRGNIHVVHQHGIWTGISRLSNAMRDRLDVSTIITPHGSLQDWALKKSSLKKKIALTLYERKNFLKAACFHAVAEPELSDIRDFGLKAPVAIIPNGISGKWLSSSGDADSFRKRFNIPREQRILLFLSRITPKKGLPMLLQSIHQLKSEFSDWVLVLAGADEFGHQAELVSQIKVLGLQDKVVITGPLYDNSKRDAFSAADLFILPSYSEGAPIVILESLAAGVPVIATKASPWDDLVRYSCGWLTEINQFAIAEALRDALLKTSFELRDMGKRGNDLVASNYTWHRSAQMTIELYEWLLGRQDRPDFVILD